MCPRTNEELQLQFVSWLFLTLLKVILQAGLNSPAGWAPCLPTLNNTFFYFFLKEVKNGPLQYRGRQYDIFMIFIIEP